MDKLYIYGAGKNGILAKQILGRYKDEQLVAFIDKNNKGNFIDNIPVIGIDDVEKNSLVVICVSNSNWILEIYQSLLEKNIKRIYFFNSNSYKEFSGNFLDDYCISCDNWGDAILPQVEIHVSDFCNLNCRGCTHFSPIFGREFPSTEIRLNDIGLLADKFSHVIYFYLLGGEPFLNPDINIFIKCARKKLTNSIITIVTNGLLIPKLSDEVLDCIRENEVVVSVSEYEPTHRIIGQIEHVLKLHNIRYYIRPFNTKEQFNKPLALSANHNRKRLCISSICTNIYNGKISRCPTLMYIDKFNEVFGTSLPNTGIMDMCSMEAKPMIQRLKEEIPLCVYCIENPIEWSCCGVNPVLSDFAE